MHRQFYLQVAETRENSGFLCAMKRRVDHRADADTRFLMYSLLGSSIAFPFTRTYVYTYVRFDVAF